MLRERGGCDHLARGAFDQLITELAETSWTSSDSVACFDRERLAMPSRAGAGKRRSTPSRMISRAGTTPKRRRHWRRSGHVRQHITVSWRARGQVDAGLLDQQATLRRASGSPAP